MRQSQSQRDRRETWYPSQLLSTGMMAAPAETPSCQGVRVYVCVCVCVCVWDCVCMYIYTGLWGCNRWGIYCSDSVRSHWWRYQWDVTHTHTHTARQQTANKCTDVCVHMQTHTNRLSLSLSLSHTSRCSSDGWGIIRMKKLSNKVVLCWMCSVTSCQLFTDLICQCVCEEHLALRRMFPVVKKRGRKGQKAVLQLITLLDAKSFTKSLTESHLNLWLNILHLYSVHLWMVYIHINPSISTQKPPTTKI